MIERDKQIGVRLTAEELAKLDELAERTDRNWSQVMRRLLAAAEVGPSDIRLNEKAVAAEVA
ncbi:MAG TPA: ribbon-helix-helix protein, CopG family [Vicinamibacterales bacterium]|nr:ribbon-helix-helix protein, CopG family [Vicinamibacterales bacterium]